MNIKIIWAGIVLGLISFSATISVANDFDGHINVQLEPLTQRAKIGQQVFNDNCAVCHGQNASGTRIGPPLIHKIYNPGHHNNASFSRAVTKGVQQHHWPYGNMPAQKHVGFSDLSNILAFIREVQQTNGVAYENH